MRMVLVTVLGIMVGALAMWAFLSTREVSHQTIVDRLAKVESDNTALRGQVRSLSGQVVTARQTEELHAAELRALVAHGPNTKLAASAINEYAVASANSAGVAPPAKEEFDNKKLSDTTKQNLEKQTENTTEKLDNAAKDLNLEDCKKLVQGLKPNDKAQQLGSPDGVAQLAKCRSQIEEKRQAIDKEYKDNQCDQNPDTEQCKRLAPQKQEADAASTFIRILLVIAALILIFNGDVETGLLLLALANSAAAGGDSGQQGQQQGQQPGTSQVSTNQNPPSPAVGNSGGNWGTSKNGELTCNSDGKVLTCWRSSDASKNAIFKLDPSNTLTKPLSASRQPVADSLSQAISKKNTSAVTFCKGTAETPVTGVVLQSGANSYSIAVTGPPNFQLAYPEKDDFSKKDCSEF